MQNNTEKCGIPKNAVITNSVPKKFTLFFHSIDSFIAKICLYALNRPKMNFEGYLSFESTVEHVLYLTDTYIFFTLKMESVSKNTIFWPTFSYFIKVPKITNLVIKITIFPHGGISK